MYAISPYNIFYRFTLLLLWIVVSIAQRNNDGRLFIGRKAEELLVHMGTGTMCILIIAELLQFRFSHTHQPLAVIGLFA